MSRVTMRHGLSYDPVYRAWQTVRQRCTNPSNQAYPDYGGRGIGVCASWVNDPAQFIADMGPKPTPKHELDREDNHRGYDCGKCEDCLTRGASPNCRWVTRSVNDRNRRSNRMLTYQGQTKTVAEWSDQLHISGDTICKRLAPPMNWDVDRALSTPPRCYVRKTGAHHE